MNQSIFMSAPQERRHHGNHHHAGAADSAPNTPELERVQNLLLERYRPSYRVVMLFYRLGRRLRGKQSVADGAALAITPE